MLALCTGRQRKLAWGEDPNGNHRGRDYYEGLSLEDQAKFTSLFRRLSDELHFHNDTRFKKEVDGLFCLKSGRHRLAAFFFDGDLIIIAGFEKKTRRDRRSAKDMKIALGLKNDYENRRRDSA